MSYLLVERDASQISDIQLAAHASDFVYVPINCFHFLASQSDAKD